MISLTFTLYYIIVKFLLLIHYLLNIYYIIALSERLFITLLVTFITLSESITISALFLLHYREVLRIGSLLHYWL